MAAVTSTAIVQLAWAAASTPPESAIEPLPATAATAPPQVFTRPFGLATATPTGSVSVKARPDCAGLPAPLAIVKVSVEVPSRPIAAGAKALPRVVPTTENDAFAVAAVRPPARPDMFALLFTYVPSTPAVTLTVAVQVATPAASAPPESVTEPAPADGAKVAPHVFDAAGAAATVTPAGSVSVKPRPVTAWDPAGLVSVKVRVVVPPAAMAVGAKALVSWALAKYCTLAVGPLKARPGEAAEMLPAALV